MAAAGRPAEPFLTQPQPARLGDQGVGPAVERQALVQHLIHRLGAELAQPGAVGPGQSSGAVHDPGRNRRGVAQQRQAALGRIGSGQDHAGRRRQAQPGDPAGDPAFDAPRLDVAEVDQALERLSGLDQGLDRNRMAQPQPRQYGLARLALVHARPHGGVRGGQSGDQFGRADGRTARLAFGRQGQADVVEGAQHAVVAAQIGLGGVTVPLGGGGGGAQTRAQPQGPGADTQSQSGCACSGDIGDVGLGHSCPWVPRPDSPLPYLNAARKSQTLRSRHRAPLRAPPTGAIADG